MGGRRVFCSPKYPEQLWGPLSFLFSGYQMLFSSGKVELASHLSLVVRLKMSAYMPFLPLICLHNRDRNNFTFHYIHIVGRVAHLLQQLATGWTVWDSIPVGGEIFRTCPDWPWGPPSLLYNGYKERPGHDADPSPPSSAVVMKG